MLFTVKSSSRFYSPLWLDLRFLQQQLYNCTFLNYISVAVVIIHRMYASQGGDTLARDDSS
jgi:hypothetical protein